MDYERIKKQANEILKAGIAESAYIEYKVSAKQKGSILKTICAYGNNYYDREIQMIFIGVEEMNNEELKAVPRLPLAGIPQGGIEKAKNQLKSLKAFTYPNVDYELITNQLDGRNYIILLVPRQTGGPFMVTEKAEKDKEIKLKAGRYVRIEAETRLARIDEEYDLLRKFANFHFSSITSTDATIDDLSGDYIREYLNATSDRGITKDLKKADMATTLKLLDRNDPDEKRATNYAVLMFAEHPERFIPYAYCEMIVDRYGTKRKMEAKTFTGPLWKQYYAIMRYMEDQYLDTMTIREDGLAINRKISNFPYVAVEELVANALVHNNYENGKAIQIYISETQINIVNYNKPLPPIRVSDLNERSFFNERDTENPEIRDMFKQLGIIESFGTGIGEAKRAMLENQSPELYYKMFDHNENITSVVIPVNQEYYQIKNGTVEKSGLTEQGGASGFKQIIRDSKYSEQVKHNLLLLIDKLQGVVLGNQQIVSELGCSQVTATEYLKRLRDELHLIAPVAGKGKGKYVFLPELDLESRQVRADEHLPLSSENKEL